MAMFRKIAIPLLIMLLSTLTASAQDNEPKTAAISFEKNRYDFGSFSAKDGARKYEFRYTNTGSAPLVIVNTEVTCTCLSIDVQKKPVMPGESAVVKVTYTPKKRETGKFTNYIKVYTNTPDRRQTLTVTGEVVR